MTAVFGLIGSGGRRWSAQDLAPLSANLAPFGHEDTWIGDIGPLHVAIGQRGHEGEPLLAEQAERGILVVTSAHLAHRGELASALGLPPRTSDALLLASAYERWDLALTDHIRGEFAAVIADCRRGQVILLRDHAGRRMLAEHDAVDIHAVASTALALTGAPGVGHEVDRHHVVEVLFDANATGRTFVEGVRTVPPGSITVIDGTGTHRRRWWDGRFTIRDEGSVQAHATSMRTAFDRAVGWSVEGASTPGVLLSGGLDSASITAVVAQLRDPDPVPSYTLVPPPHWTGPTVQGWVTDERPAIDALAARYPNLRPSFVTPGTQSLFADEGWWELGCRPFRNPMTSKALFACFRDASADDVDVLLWGAAGNFAFSAGGDRWLAELARRGRFAALVREARAWSRVNDIPLRYVLRTQFLARLFPGLAERRKRAAGVGRVDDLLLVGAIAPDVLDGLDLDAMVDEVWRPGPQDYTRDLGALFSSESGQAEMLAAMSVRYGLELLDPTVDRDLLEVAGPQPGWRRNSAGEWRAIARAAMRDVLPPEIVERRELGEQLPEYLDILTAARTELRDEVEQMRDHPMSRETMDVGRLERLIEAWPDPLDRNDRQVMYEYREAIPRTIGVSRYLRWFEERARRVASGGPAVVVHDPFADFV